MGKQLLVIQDIRDCKHSPGSYSVVSVVELDPKHMPAIDVIPLTEQQAQAFRETIQKHTQPVKKK